MREFVALLAAAGLLVSAAVIVGSPAGAAGGTTCKAAKGSATFAPALPIFTSTVRVKGTLSATGTVSRCSGGGVTKGTTSFKSQKGKTGSNCTTLSKPDPKSKGTIGSFTVNWGGGKTSTAKTFTILQTKNPVRATTKGKITSGLFVGSTISGTVQYTLPKNGCTKTPLKTVTYKNIGSFSIK